MTHPLFLGAPLSLITLEQVEEELESLSDNSTPISLCSISTPRLREIFEDHKTSGPVGAILTFFRGTHPSYDCSPTAKNLLDLLEQNERSRKISISGFAILGAIQKSGENMRVKRFLGGARAPSTANIDLILDAAKAEGP